MFSSSTNSLRWHLDELKRKPNMARNNNNNKKAAQKGKKVRNKTMKGKVPFHRPITYRGKSIVVWSEWACEQAFIILFSIFIIWLFFHVRWWIAILLIFFFFFLFNRRYEMTEQGRGGGGRKRWWIGWWWRELTPALWGFWCDKTEKHGKVGHRLILFFQ